MNKNHTRSEPKLSTATPAAWKAVVSNVGLCRPVSSLAILCMYVVAKSAFHVCMYVVYAEPIILFKFQATIFN